MWLILHVKANIVVSIIIVNSMNHRIAGLLIDVISRMLSALSRCVFSSSFPGIAYLIHSTVPRAAFSQFFVTRISCQIFQSLQLKRNQSSLVFSMPSGSAGSSTDTNVPGFSCLPFPQTTSTSFFSSRSYILYTNVLRTSHCIAKSDISVYHREAAAMETRCTIEELEF